MEASQDASNLNALYQAFIMIVVSEIGDKTFLIAAILASRQPRLTVFAGAFASLVVMSVLSAAMGRIIGLVPKQWTQLAAALLFLIFGIRMLKEGLSMSESDSSEKMAEEIREVEEELAEGIPMHSLDDTSSPSYSVGGRGRGGGGGGIMGAVKGLGERAKRGMGMVANPVFVQAFVLTFLGEWGDRSQIATIALAAAHNLYVIAFGTIVGHGLCTGGAVLGGRWLSTKISVKYITLIGAVLFLIFSLLYFHEAYVFSLEPGGSLY